MKFNPEKVRDLIRFMQKQYAGWKDFSDPSYIDDEVRYKREAIEKAKELLSEVELRRLIDEANYPEIISRFKKVGSTNLLWNQVRSSGDLAILETDLVHEDVLFGEILELLYGSNPSHERLEKYQNFVEANKLSKKWTFPTYFLFMCHPDTEIFVKPTATSSFLDFLGIKNIAVGDAPSADTYNAIKQLSHQLFTDLEDYGPHDMVDIQSLIFICSKLRPSYWKIAPGANAWNWDACREGGFIAIGWEELGDISKLSKAQFDAKREELFRENPEEWKKNGVEQVWKFAHIKEGDKIIANKGTTEVLGIGTVTGPYYYIEGIRHGHRIPVKWDTISHKNINKPGWKKALIKLTEEEFIEINDFPKTSDMKYWVEKTLVAGHLDRLEGPDSLGKSLWSPQKSKDGREIYKNMLRIEPGNIILHFVDNREIAGISLAESKAVDTFVGLSGTEWEGRPAYRISLKGFKKLDYRHNLVS